MKMVKEPMELIASAGCQGVALNDTEAEILLGYLEGNDYCLMMDDRRKLWLHDNQDGERDEDDTPYTIREVIEFCQELNGDILLGEETKENSEPAYVLELRKDEMLLQHMLDRASEVVPPEVREYKVVVIEHLKKVVAVDAENWADAELKVREAWDRKDLRLGPDDFAGVSFSLGGGSGE